MPEETETTAAEAPAEPEVEPETDEESDEAEVAATGMCERLPIGEVQAVIDENLGTVPDSFDVIVDDETSCEYFSGDFENRQPDDVKVRLSLLNRTPDDDDVCPGGDQYLEFDGVGDFACGLAYAGKGQIRITFGQGQDVYQINMNNDAETMFIGEEALVAQDYTPEAWNMMQQLANMVLAGN